MLKIENVNALKLKKGLFILGSSSLLAMTACSSKYEPTSPILPEIETTSEGKDVEFEEISTETVTVEPSVEESQEVVEEVKAPVITELTVEAFNNLVDEVEKSNEAAGLKLRRSDLELAVYINNITIATPELVEKIESSYRYNEEDMINIYLHVMTAYNNDTNDYYNGLDDKFADKSVMFLDEINRDTVKYIDESFEELYASIYGFEKAALSLDSFNKMVESIMARNKELGIEISQRDIEIAVYQRNSLIASDEVRTYISSIKLNSEERLEDIDNAVLNTYKNYNASEASISTDPSINNKFSIGSLKYESYLVGEKVDMAFNYTKGTGTINGYCIDQLTVGGEFAVKMQIDDALAYFATTGYAEEYEATINAIAEARVEHCVSQTFKVLGSKAATVECQETQYTK